MKRNQHQMYENRHKEFRDIKDDGDSVDAICELYDRGVTLHMIKTVFNNISKERTNDHKNDVSDFESRL